MEPNQTVGWRESLNRPVAEAQQVLGEVGSQAGQALGELGRAVDTARQTLQRSIVAHPVKAVGLSFAAGVFLGWIIKRKS